MQNPILNSKSIVPLSLLLLSVAPGCYDTAVTNTLSEATTTGLADASLSQDSNLISAPTPGTGYSSVTITPGSGFYGSNICSGSKILNLSGTANCSYCKTTWFSTAGRGVGSTRITTQQEAGTYAGIDLPVNYRSVPQFSSNDDGVCTGDISKSVCAYRTKIEAIPASVHNSFKPCGTSQSTVSERIADCASVNGSAWTTWNGLYRGTGGESVWQLVTVASNTGAAPYGEVWLDTKTQRLWSSRTAAAIPSPPAISPYSDLPAPWCAAAGNDSNCDPASNNACGTTNQNYCAHNQTSYCTEVLQPVTRSVLAGSSFVNESFNGSSSVYASSKGKLGYYSTPSISWALPSLSEYDIADADGIRYVMADMGALASSSDQEWTATLDSSSSNRRNAFVFSSMKGLVTSLDRSLTSVFARCTAPLEFQSSQYANGTATAVTGFYTRQISITTATSLPASSLPFYLDTSSLISAGKLNSSCSNLKFFQSDQVSSVPYYLESGCNTSSTLFWLRVPAFSSSTSVYFVYGGVTAGQVASFSSTFPNSYTATTGATGTISTATYDSFSVPSGAIVTAATGSAVHITANRISIAGSVNLDGRGYPGSLSAATAGSGPGAPLGNAVNWGAGAGHAGAGGCGQTLSLGSPVAPCATTGGSTYGSANSTIDSDSNSLGSGGSSGSDSGKGYGGGAIFLVGKIISLQNTASLSASGNDGAATSISSVSQGGGSGGTLYFSADTSITLAGTLTAKGGRAGNLGAGGGGGGVIKINTPGSISDSSTKVVTGATQTSNGTTLTYAPSAGSNGATYSGVISNATTYIVGSESVRMITP